MKPWSRARLIALAVAVEAASGVARAPRDAARAVDATPDRRYVGDGARAPRTTMQSSERPLRDRRTTRLSVVWLLVILLGPALRASADEIVPAGPGVGGAWEAGLRGSFQRLSDGIVTSEVSLGTFLGYYVHPALEPFVGLSLDFQDAHVPGGASVSGVNLSAGAGVRGSFELADRVRTYLALSPGLLLRTSDVTGFDSEDQLDFVASVQVGLQVVLVPRVALDVGFAYDRIFSGHGEDLLTVPLAVSFFF
jgi:hypothetical protein